MFHENERTDYESVAENLYGSGNSVVSSSSATITNGVSPDTPADHKQEILATRIGGFGSSDAKMIIEIARAGKVYKAEHLKRLAVFEGLIPPDDFSNKYTEIGHQREKEIVDYCNAYPPNCSYAIFTNNQIYNDTKNIFSDDFKCFSHIDMVESWDDTKYNIYEIKASQDSTESLKERYDAQLKWHCVLADRTIITLLHYKEKHDGADFNKDNIVITRPNYSKETMQDFINEVRSGLEIIKRFLADERLNNYTILNAVCEEKKELITTNLELSEATLKQIQELSNFMKSVKEMEHKKDKLKEVLLKVMTEQNIYKWNFEDMKFTKIDECVSVSFDTKKFEQEHQELYKQYYTKETNKKSHLRIELNNNISEASNV